MDESTAPFSAESPTDGQANAGHQQQLMYTYSVFQVILRTSKWLMGAIGFVAMVINLVVLGVVVRRRLYAVDNLYVFVGLLCALDSVCGLSLLVKAVLDVTLPYQLGWCHLGQLFMRSTSLWTLWTLTILSVDQFVHIIHPLAYVTRITRKTISFMVVGVILLGIVDMILFLSFWEERGLCDYFMNLPMWFHVVNLCEYYIPLGVCVCLQLRCFLVARRHVRQISLVLKDLPSNPSTASGVHGMKAGQKRAGGIFKTSATMMIVMVTFLVFWLPMGMVSLPGMFTSDGRFSSSETAFAGVVLVVVFYLNLILNPLIYAVRLSEIRLGIRENYMRCQSQ